MNKIKVLHVTFDMEIGGTEQVIRQLLENCNPIYEMSILCLDNKVGPLGNILFKQGFSISSLDRKSGFDIGLAFKIKEHILNNDIKIVHCHQYTPYIYGLLGSLNTEAKTIFTEHGRFYPDTYKIKRILINPLLSFLTSTITTISEATKSAMIQYEFFPKYKIKVIYNGIADCSEQHAVSSNQLKKEIGIEGNEIILGTIARLDPIKNQSMMINAFKEVISVYKNTKLLIIGDGPERQRLEIQVTKNSLEDHVIFTGFINDPNKYYKIIDIYLLSSFSEGTSMTLLESMSYGKPSIVTDVGGNSEIVIDGKTGYVTPCNDIKIFQSRIVELINNKQLRLKLGSAARKRFDAQFTVDKMIDSYSEIYSNVILD